MRKHLSRASSLWLDASSGTWPKVRTCSFSNACGDRDQTLPPLLVPHVAWHLISPWGSPVSNSRPFFAECLWRLPLKGCVMVCLLWDRRLVAQSKSASADDQAYQLTVGWKSVNISNSP